MSVWAWVGILSGLVIALILRGGWVNNKEREKHGL
jgi:hypothetical protein